LVKKFFDPDYLLHQIVKSRQLGVSTLYSAISLWLITFFPTKTVAVVATDRSTAQELHEKLLFAYDNLPPFLMVKWANRTTTVLKLKNGSRIKAYASRKNSGIRGIAASVFIMDEAHFIVGANKIFSQIEPTLNTGGQLIALSSPAEPVGWFYETYTNILAEDSEFKLTQLPWYVHPERQLPDGSPDWEWRKKKDRTMDKREASQEYDAEFGFSLDSYFDPDFIKRIESNMVREPIRKEGHLWIWEEPQPDQSYIVSVDCAEGGNDKNVVQVISVPQMVQVAEYVSKIHYEEFGWIPVPIARRYNSALLVIEANAVGTAIVQRSKDLSYHNIYIRGQGKEGKILGITKKDFGWKTTMKTRPLIIKQLEQCIEVPEIDEALQIRSIRTLTEIKTFKMINGKAQAETKNKATDDCLMALGIGVTVYSLRGDITMKTTSTDTMDEYLGMLALGTARTKEKMETYLSKKETPDENMLSDNIKTQIRMMDYSQQVMNSIIPKHMQKTYSHLQSLIIKP
jgi:hypothetical protein